MPMGIRTGALRSLRQAVWLTWLVAFVCTTPSIAQFRAQENRERYQEPYKKPTTENPYVRRFPNPNDPADGAKQYHHSENVRYRGYNEYLLNERGHPGYGGRNIDRFRLNYDHRDDSLQDYELKNTIFDVWRADLQGEKRPGQTPGLNLPLAEDVFVSTDTGKVQGFYVYLYDRPEARFDERPANKDLELQRHYLNVTTFLGIPYAQPPIFEGRFKPPRRVRNWHTTWQAIDYSPACPQNLKYVGATKGIRNGIDEDCLYLNIFTPSLSVNAREKYPVMFHIHGGDFDHGSGSQFPGHMLSAWGEVVVVTFNYRLGALGFLSTGDYNSPGNYGLMDMALALEWVYQNIRFFNGDRDRITVFGPGAGGAAAGLLAVIPKTREYVSQVIAESGSPLADWAAIDDVYRVQNTSRVFGLEMGCNVDTAYNIVNCLNNRDYEEIATAPIIPDVGTFPWSPVVDSNFTVPEDSWYEDWSEEDWRILPELPIKLYMRNEHHPVLRYLTGVNRDEAANMVFTDPRVIKNNMVVTETFFNERVKEWVKHYNYSLNPEGAYDAIKWMYTFWPDPHNVTHIREQYVHMMSDALYKSPVDQIVKVLTNNTNKRPVPTYYYLLNTTVEALKLPYWREIPTNLEFYFISGAPFMDPDFYPETIRVSRQQWTEGDRNISMFMMKAWANFAKWGNPTQQQVYPIKIKWEQTLQDELKYLSINTTFNTSIHYNYLQTESTFWYEYMPMVVREWIPTPPPPKNPWIDMTEPVTATMYAFLAITVLLVVILFACCGLWKSAKRQRNKALDDLSYYSVENLSLCNGNELSVRNYLEKLDKSQVPSRSGTLNTVLSTDHGSRTGSPTVGSGANGKVFAIGEPDYSTLKSHKVDSYPVPHKKASNLMQERAVHARPQEALQKRPASEMKMESSSLRPSSAASFENRGQLNTSGFSEIDKVSMDQQPSYDSQDPHSLYYRRPVNQILQDTNPQRVGHQDPRRNPTQINPPPVALPRHTIPAPNGTEFKIPLLENPPMRILSQDPAGYESRIPTHDDAVPREPPAMYAPQETIIPSRDPYSREDIGIPFLSNPPRRESSNKNADPAGVGAEIPPATGIDEAQQGRPMTPNAALTFEISMKPSRSVGTISNASGMILNTEL